MLILNCFIQSDLMQWSDSTSYILHGRIYFINVIFSFFIYYILISIFIKCINNVLVRHFESFLCKTVMNPMHNYPIVLHLTFYRLNLLGLVCILNNKMKSVAKQFNRFVLATCEKLGAIKSIDTRIVFCASLVEGPITY